MAWCHAILVDLYRVESTMFLLFFAVPIVSFPPVHVYAHSIYLLLVDVVCFALFTVSFCDAFINVKCVCHGFYSKNDLPSALCPLSSASTPVRSLFTVRLLDQCWKLKMIQNRSVERIAFRAFFFVGCFCVYDVALAVIFVNRFF